MHSLNDFRSVGLYISRLFDQAAEHGVTMEICDDFRELHEIVSAIDERAPLTPIFDWRYSDIGQDNGFWIKGTASDGQIVHMQAARLDRIEGQTLAEYLRRHASLYLSPHIPAIAEQSVFDSCNWAKEQRGSVCYHGEVWITPRRGYRGRGLGRILPRIVPPIAYRKWQPDCFYGMMAPTLAEKGMSAQYGYTHLHPLGVRWKLRDQNGTFDEYITWMTPEDLSALAEAAISRSEATSEPFRLPA